MNDVESTNVLFPLAPSVSLRKETSSQLVDEGMSRIIEDGEVDLT